MKRILISSIIALTTVLGFQSIDVLAETNTKEEIEETKISVKEVQKKSKLIDFGANNKFSVSKNSENEYFKIKVTDEGYVTITCDRALFAGGEEDDIYLTLKDETGKKMFLDGWSKDTKYKDEKTFIFKIGLEPGEYYGRLYSNSSINTGEMELNYKVDFTKDTNFEIESYKDGYYSDVNLKKEIKMGEVYHGITNESAERQYIDTDAYAFTVDKEGGYKIESEVMLNAKYDITLKDRYDRVVYSFTNSEGKKHKNIFKNLSQGDYYLSISNRHNGEIMQKEYSFKISEAKNGWIYDDSKYYYYIDDVMQKGFINVDGEKYFLDTKTGVARTGWLNDYGDWYYLNSSGAVQKGWFNDGYSYYYFNDDGIMQVGKEEIDRFDYYFNKSGIMQIGWQNNDSTWYYYNSNGTMKTGWFDDGYDWYYLKEVDGTDIKKGQILRGECKVSGVDYYFNESGTMHTGWRKIDGGKWKYYNFNGSMRTGWLNDGGAWYYFNNYGEMVTDNIYINGSYEHFADNGVWLG